MSTRGILVDVNCEGQARRVLQQIQQGWRGELWSELSLTVFSFSEFGLDATASDRVVWETCQRERLLLITANRNADGHDSLQVTIQLLNDANSLPVVTLADTERIRRDSEYAETVGDRLLQILVDIENYFGTGRLYAP